MTPDTREALITTLVEIRKQLRQLGIDEHLNNVATLCTASNLYGSDFAEIVTGIRRAEK